MILFCCASELGPPEDLSAIEVILYYYYYYREMNRADLAYDRVPYELIWWCLRKNGVPEEYVTIIQDM